MADWETFLIGIFVYSKKIINRKILSMKHKISFVLLLSMFFSATIYSQNFWYLVQLTDKDNNDYSIDEPELFLSQRAIDRRAAMGISIDETDLPISSQYVQGVEDLGVNIANKLKWINSLIVNSNEDLQTQIEALTFVETVTVMNTPSWAAGQQKAFFDQEKLKLEAPQTGKNMLEVSEIDYGAADNQIKMMNGHVLHDEGYTGEGMVIAVLDAGFKQVDVMDVFKPLFDNNQILSTRDVIRPQENVFSSTSHYHGSAVLSTMAANVPGVMVGTAPDAHYHLIVTEDQYAETLLEEYWWIDGAEYADSVGADVINSSLGYSLFDYSADDHSYDQMDGETTAITKGSSMAMNKGILVVTSAGNSGDASWYYITAPADGKDAFTIGAVDQDGNSASFSSHGPTFDGRVKPDVVAHGQNVAYAVPDGFGGMISYGNGTSFSSPIIAGMSACFWQANPQLSNFDVKENIILSADKVDKPDGNYGYGLPDFEKAMNALAVPEIHSEDDLFVIFPNPINKYNYMKMKYMGDSTVDVEIAIYNQIGSCIATQKTNFRSGQLFEFNGELASGVYFVNIDSEAFSKRIKFIVI